MFSIPDLGNQTQEALAALKPLAAAGQARRRMLIFDLPWADKR
jgi:hypothetical protein